VKTQGPTAARHGTDPDIAVYNRLERGHCYRDVVERAIPAAFQHEGPRPEDLVEAVRTACRQRGRLRPPTPVAPGKVAK
jgi:hypothetical protein